MENKMQVLTKENKYTQKSMPKIKNYYEKLKLLKTFGSILSNHNRRTSLKYTSAVRHSSKECSLSMDDTETLNKKLVEEVYFILKEKYGLVSKKREKFYLKNEKLSSIDLIQRYSNANAAAVSQVSSMTSQEKRVYEFLHKVVNDDKKLKLPALQNDLLPSRLQNKIQNIRVYKQHKPFIDELYKNKHKPSRDAATQTYEFNSYLTPLWKISNVPTIQRTLKALEIENRPKISYSAYDLRRCRYLRLNSSNDKATET